jgi:hypothetical protein
VRRERARGSAAEQRDELAPCRVDHGGFPPEPAVPAYRILACRRSTRRSLG